MVRIHRWSHECVPAVYGVVVVFIPSKQKIPKDIQLYREAPWILRMDEGFWVKASWSWNEPELEQF